jgi:hypothetical protein
MSTNKMIERDREVKVESQIFFLAGEVDVELQRDEGNINGDYQSETTKE